MWRGTSHSSDERQSLQPLDETFSEAKTFHEADQLRVRLSGVMVQERRDRFKPPGRWHNDLIVKTRYRFKNEPPVDRLHYIEKEQRLGWRGDFFDDVIVSLPDLQNDRLHLRVQVYDVDGVNTDLVDTIQKFSESSAVLFPQLATYANIARLGSKPLVDLVNNIDQHDEILDDELWLEITQPQTRHKLLQPGYFVCFRDESVSGDLTLDDDLRVLQDGDAYTDGSYAVLELDKNHELQPKREIDQRVAKIVAELAGKGRSSESALHFLRETLEAYSKYEKLERLRELDGEPHPSARCNARAEELRDELKADPVLGPALRMKESGQADD